MRLLLLPLALTLMAAVPAAAKREIAFTATARPRAARVTLNAHPEVIAQRQGSWDRPPNWRWMSDAEQLAWSLQHFHPETPVCRIVLKRRLRELTVLKAIMAEPAVLSGRPAQDRILALREEPSEPLRDFFVPLELPDGKKPTAECGEDPRIALRAQLSDLERGAAACAAVARDAEARIKPLSWPQTTGAIDAFRRCGDLDGIERVLRGAVKQFEANAPKHPERPQALYELGTLLVSRGRLIEAEIQLRRAVDLSLSVGVAGTDLAAAAEELADLYDVLGESGEAKRRLVQAIALYEQAARAAGLAPAGQLRGIAKDRLKSNPRAAELFARRAEQLAVLGPESARRRTAK